MDLGNIILAVLQGVFEWLPVSSKTVLFLYSVLVSGYTPGHSYVLALALQGGTVLSAVVYFWREICNILLLRNRRLLMFVTVTTFATAMSALPLYFLYMEFLDLDIVHLTYITIALGILFIVQALIASRARPGEKKIEEVTFRDAVLMGIAQGLATTPGVSRSGTTVVFALYRGYTVEDAFKLSFLASIPANLGALLIVYLTKPNYLPDFEKIAPILAISTAVGYTSIGLLIKLAKRYSYRLTLALGLVVITIGLMSALSTP